MTEPKDNGERIPTVSLREFFQHLIDAQTVLLDERAKSHGREHVIHDEAHKREHESTQTAIGVASTALNSKLENMEKEFGSKIDIMIDQIKAIILERASTKGYILGVGAVIGFLIVIANFVAPILLGNR